MANYSDMGLDLDVIRQKIKLQRDHLARARHTIDSAVTSLGAMSTDYAQLVQDVDAFLVANPSNQAAITMKAQKDLLVAEFVALKNTALAQQAALAAL